MQIEDNILIRVNNKEIQNGTFVIPDGIKEIGNFAFRDCINLRNIYIPNGVFSIGDHAFEFCENLESIKIPNGVNYIGKDAFLSCTRLKNIEMPDRMGGIGTRAFGLCVKLKNIKIPKGIWKIEEHTFEKCHNLENIQFSENIRYIGERAFCDCNSLKRIEIPKNIKTIEEELFAGCDNLESIKLPEGIKSIEDDAFYGCNCLKDITIPSTVEYIGERAFYKCSNLENIYLQEGLKAIGENAFFKCDKLTYIKIPNTVKEIGTGAFRWCSNLRMIELPETIEDIDVEIFRGCDSLEKIKMPKNIEDKVFEDIFLNGIFKTEQLKKILGKPFEKSLKICDSEIFDLIVIENEEEELNELEDHAHFFLYRMIKCIGEDETDRVFRLPNMSEEEIKRAVEINEKAYSNLYDTKYKINGDLGITLKILKEIAIYSKKHSDGRKNSLEQEILKNINKSIEDGYEGTLVELIQSSIDGKIDEKFIQKIKEEERKASKNKIERVLKENESKIIEAIMQVNSNSNERIAERQVIPIKVKIEDAIRNSYMEKGKIDSENIEKILMYELENNSAPYIRLNSINIVENVKNLINEKEFLSAANGNIVNSIRNIKEEIGGKWRYKLERTLNSIGYSIESVPYGLTLEEINKIKEGTNLKKGIELEKVAILKSGANLEDAYRLLRQTEIKGIITFRQMHDMFGSVHPPYTEEFKKFYKLHRSEFLNNPELYPIFGKIQNNFSEIISSPELSNIYDSGKLTIEHILGYLKAKNYANQRKGDEELAKYSRMYGISNEEEFKYAQKISDIVKKRERTSVPPMKVREEKYRGRMISPDDVLNMFAGDMTTCCQRFKDVGEGAMLLGAIEENAGIFVIEELDDNAEAKRIVGQSLTIRQKGKEGHYDRLTFDNIEISNNVKLSDEDSKKILDIYKNAAEQAIVLDEKFLRRQVEEGKITKEQYESLRIKEVVAGTGYNDLKGLGGLDKAEIVVPEQANYTYKGMNNHSVHPWIDSAGGRAKWGSKGIPVILAKSKIGRKGSKISKMDEVPLWYGKVGKVTTLVKDEIHAENIEEIKKIEEAVYRKEQQILSNANSVYDIQNLYDIENPTLKIGSNKDWYMIYDEDDNNVIIADLALYGGIKSKRNKTLENSNVKIATLEASYEIYKLLLEATNKKIYCSATEDTSLKDIEKLIEKGMIEVRDEYGKKIVRRNSILVYEDSNKPIKGNYWNIGSKIKMFNLEIIPNKEALRSEFEKIKELFDKVSSNEKLKGAEKNEEIEKLRSEVR